MATRRKRSNSGEPTVAHLTVVLEQNQAQFKAFGEALTALGRRMDARFDQVDARFERLDLELALVKVAVLENARDTKNKVDRDEVLAIVHDAGS
jgi:hypothetical protein